MTSTYPAPDFRSEARGLLDSLQTLRRAMHEHAEVGLDLPLTQQSVLDALADLGLEITTGKALTSVVAVLRGAKPGPTVLLRGDMDALPIEEDNDLEYRAANGAMHACGHDLHTAGLVGAAQLLAAHRDELAGSVVFMFQPGEEGWGGAQLMLEEGLLEASGEIPIRAYAVHVGTGPRGIFSTRPGPILASSSTIRATLEGRGGHASSPSYALDPVPALAELVLAMQSVVTRRVDVLEPAVLTITQLSAGQADNVIADRASLSGTLRTFTSATLDLLRVELNRATQGVAAAHGLTASFELISGYQVTHNDEAATTEAEDLIRATFGDERYQRLPNPHMASEDFSFVLGKVPGVFVFLGALPDHIQPGTVHQHSPRVVFDDSVLGDQAALLAQLAWQHLG